VIKVTVAQKRFGQLAAMNQIMEKKRVMKTRESICYHCGDLCLTHSIVLDEKPFCCEGCKMVYSILNENDLGTFYELNESAGISQKNISKQEYAFLDDEDAIAKLIDFKSEHLTKIHFYLPQIHCSSCLWLLEHLHRLNDGILNSRVDFLKKEVVISFSHDSISLRHLVELLAMIGYPPIIQLHDLDDDHKPTADKSLYYKLGLAGFAFGNIMLFSFPEYLGLAEDKNSSLGEFFRFINVVLILPVVLYSGQDYFKSAWQGIKQNHLNIDVPVSLGILALFSRSMYEIMTHTGAGYLDSLAVLIFFLLIGKWFQQTTYSKISFDRDYKSYFPIAATIKKGEEETQVTLDKIKKGDLLLLRHGELIPVDSILIKGESKIDYSFVSGESALIEKPIGSQLYAGGRQMGGIIEVTALKKVRNSYLTQLWNDHNFSKNEDKGKASALAHRVAKFFTWTILLVASLSLIYWMPKNSSVAINAFTAVLIIACPCAVALSIPFTFGNVVRIFAKSGIYFKNIQVVETLSKVNHIVFDKTGTLTYSKSGELKYHGHVLSAFEEQYIRSVAHLSNHPMSRQLVRHFEHHATLEVHSFNEMKGSGIEGTVDGHHIRIGSFDFIKPKDIGPDKKSSSNLFVSIDQNFKGAFQLISHYRSGLKKVITSFKKWAHLSLLSGDNDSEKGSLGLVFGSEKDLFFNQKPEQKLAFIKQKQTSENSIAMIGDGLNDAGALSQSEIGIVITEDTSNFTPACDIILSAKNFKNLPLLFSFSRLSIQLVYIAYFIALLYNIIGLYFAVQGELSPVIAAILMPLSSVSIVLFGVGASTWLAYRKGLLKS
jgi:Cu+-exporting ATPase